MSFFSPCLVGLQTCGDLEIPLLFLTDRGQENNPEIDLLFKSFPSHGLKSLMNCLAFSPPVYTLRCNWTPQNAGAALQLFVVFLHPTTRFLKLREWRREASLRDYLTFRLACILLPRQVTGAWHSLFLTSSPRKMLVTRPDPWANF